MPLLLRQDNFTAAKRPNCNTGEPCGGSCIDPREQCNVELPPQIKAKVEDLRNSLLGTVPGIAEYNTAKAAVTAFNNIRKSGTRGQQAMYLGAVLVGASLLGYSKYREKYREGFPNSAEVAQRRAKGMANSIPDIGGKQNIIFAVDSSLSKGDKGRGGGLADELMKDAGFATKYHITSIKQNAHENPKDMDSLSPRDRKIAEAMVPIKQALQNARNGQSDAAVELASQILAYNDRYSTRTTTKERNEYNNLVDVTRGSDLNINVLGHGDGGMVAGEAMEILKRVHGGSELANRINVIGLNTPDGGLTEAVGKVRTIASRNSPLSLLPMKKKVTMDAPDGEGGRAMLRKKEVREFIDGHFGGNPADIPTAKVEAPRADVPVAATAPASGQKVLDLRSAQPPVAAKAPTPTQSTFAQSSGVAKTSNIGASSQSDTERIAISRTRMVNFSNELLRKGTAKAEELKASYPDLTPKEFVQAQSLYNAPSVIKQMLKSGDIQPTPAARIAVETKTAKDRGDFEDFMTELEQFKSVDFSQPSDVDYVVEEFRKYKQKAPNFNGDSSTWKAQVNLLSKRIDALKLRVA
jgi:hypothetical protein